MIKPMRHLEAHLIESNHDAQQAELAGLDLFDDDSCNNCHEPIGDNRVEKFKPFVILLDDESEWVVCKECADPIL